MHRLSIARVFMLVILAAGAGSIAAQPAEKVNWTTGVSYTYDGAGSTSVIGSDDYVYDDVGRLVQAEVNSFKRNYTYDAFGNRKTCAHDPATDCQFDFTINPANNRIVDATYDKGIANGAGNVTTLRQHNYSYDAVNMMTSDNASQFVYTADDERIAVYTSGAGTWRWTLRGGRGKVLRELTSRNGSSGFGKEGWSWTKDYVWRDDLLLASRQPEQGGTVSTYHYHLDHLGTPRRITDGNDKIAGFHDYYAFGPEVFGGLNEPSFTRLKYTGHERDDEPEPYSLDYMHARYYNNSLGRFLSVDPKPGWQAAAPQSWNRYSYALNDPLKYLDLDGREITIAVTRRSEHVIDVNVRLTIEVHREKGARPRASEFTSRLQGAANFLGGTFETSGGNTVNIHTTIDAIFTKSGGTDKSRHQVELLEGRATPGYYHLSEFGGNESWMNEGRASAKFFAHEFAHWFGLEDPEEVDPRSDEVPWYAGNLLDNQDESATGMKYEQWQEIMRMHRDGQLNQGIKKKDP
jgi:RHS repeat-associated protein